MTNRLAIILGALIACAVILDLLLLEGANSLFLVKKLLELMEWIAFWR